jgi:hypothetical protein
MQRTPNKELGGSTSPRGGVFTRGKHGCVPPTPEPHRMSLVSLLRWTAPVPTQMPGSLVVHKSAQNKRAPHCCCCCLLLSLPSAPLRVPGHLQQLLQGLGNLGLRLQGQNGLPQGAAEEVRHGKGKFAGAVLQHGRLDCPVFCRHRCCHLSSCFDTARGTRASIPNKSSTVAARCRVLRPGCTPKWPIGIAVSKLVLCCGHVSSHMAGCCGDLGGHSSGCVPFQRQDSNSVSDHSETLAALISTISPCETSSEASAAATKTRGAARETQVAEK